MLVGKTEVVELVAWVICSFKLPENNDADVNVLMPICSSTKLNVEHKLICLHNLLFLLYSAKPNY